MSEAVQHAPAVSSSLSAKKFKGNKVEKTRRSRLERLPDVLCFSHLRWDFVFQRPQHLLTRYASESRVFYVEEPIFDAVSDSTLKVTQKTERVFVITPHLVPQLQPFVVDKTLKFLLDDLIEMYNVESPLLWYYTPMALPFTSHLKASAIVYDCMDELANFKFAPASLRELETELVNRADVVFTGGVSLYENKIKQFPHRKNIYAFPSSVDVSHFRKARLLGKEVDEQRSIARPRLGFFGVLDERLDIELLAHVADQRSDWQIILIGPICKITPESIPMRANVHLLGKKTYEELPSYLAGWDVALLPFAINEATRFISPTKTPEYLAAGKPVVSTEVRDVVTPYESEGLVEIGRSPAEFVAKIEKLLAGTPAGWRTKVDKFLEKNSWEKTWASMRSILLDQVEERIRHEAAAAK